MFEQARAHMKGTFNFLDTLDCYIGNQNWMVQEVNDFTNNPQRQIAALVCQNLREKVTYEAPYIRIHYVLSGSIELHIDNKVLNYSAGCLIMANEWTKMDYLETSSHVEVISFLFKKEYFTDNVLYQLYDNDSLMYRFFLENAKTNVRKSNFFVYQFNPADDIHLFALLLLKQVVKMKYEINRITKPAFVLFVTEIGGLSDKHLQLKDSSLSSGILMYKILADIENNYFNVSLAELGEKYHYHPNYLSGIIKDETGKTFSELLIECRLKHACQYLSQTKMTIQEIIDRIGYSDKTYFFKIFKKQNGLTPAQYRKKMQAMEQ